MCRPPAGYSAAPVNGLGGDGLGKLLSTLGSIGSDATLADLEGHHLAVENVRMILQGGIERGLPFDDAWATAINRLQPSQAGGVVDHTLARELRESRELLEEDRPVFRAAYEQRPMTTRERAQRVAAAWRRLDLPGPRPRAARERRAA